jgi:hypothetical protein
MPLILPFQELVQHRLIDLGLLLLTGTFAAMIVMPLYLLGHLHELAVKTPLGLSWNPGNHRRNSYDP